MGNKTSTTLAAYTDALQKQGRISFSLDDVVSQLGTTVAAARLSIHRLLKKKRIYRAYRHFYVIVPLEYQNTGCPPPDWFIDPLMHHLKTDYYVGLLSAAALHGAAHQQPMIFQVMTPQYPRVIKLPSMDIHLYQSRYIYKIGIEQKKTATGYMNISSPELTAFDLVRYPHVSGHYNHIATVLSELGEHLRPKRLATLVRGICQKNGEWIYGQRLGYLLDCVGFKESADSLAEYMVKYQPSFGYLIAGRPDMVFEKSERWRLYINERIEADL